MVVTPLLIHPASHHSTYLAYISRGEEYPHLQDHWCHVFIGGCRMIRSPLFPSNALPGRLLGGAGAFGLLMLL